MPFQRLTHDNAGSKMEAILETAYHTNQKNRGLHSCLRSAAAPPIYSAAKSSGSYFAPKPPGFAVR
jgi:hypothetical protein